MQMILGVSNVIQSYINTAGLSALSLQKHHTPDRRELGPISQILTLEDSKPVLFVALTKKPPSPK